MGWCLSGPVWVLGGRALVKDDQGEWDMSKWIVTIVLRGNRYVHAEFESEEAARSAHKDLFTKLNSTLGSTQQPFAEIGNHLVG